MLRFLFRLTMLGLAIGGAAYALGYRLADVPTPARAAAGAAAGAAKDALGDRLDRERLRETRVEIGSAIAGGADAAEAKLAGAQLTTKIKAKMALDDMVPARRLDVDTRGTVVTVSGSVQTASQRQRALQLARETAGVTSVVDRIDVTGR